jgi:hypothetical protein
MRKKAIIAAAAVAGILASAVETGILGSIVDQQTRASAAVAANSAVRIHYVVTARMVPAAPDATVPSPGNADTALQFTVGTSGLLNISVPDNAYLGAANPGTTSTAASIGTVTVTDTRSAASAAWTTTASSTGLTTTAGAGFTIPATAITYNIATGPSVDFGTVTPTDHTPLALSGTPAAVVSVTGSGNNTVSWNPQLTVTVPAGAITGTYTGTLTHSVA